MMRPNMMFTLVISKILLTRMPLDLICILDNFITHPEITHFHRSRALSFNSVVGNANGGGVIAMNVSFWLGMAEFFKRESENHPFFAVEE
jgi:hypothetical protein